MDFQQIYQLYDYYSRMYEHYDIIWLSVNNEEFHLANEFFLLKNHLERVLNDF